MKNRYFLVSEFSPDDMTASVRRFQRAGFEMHGELSTCTWEDATGEQKVVFSQWMKQELTNNGWDIWYREVEKIPIPDEVE